MIMLAPRILVVIIICSRKPGCAIRQYCQNEATAAFAVPAGISDRYSGGVFWHVIWNPEPTPLIPKVLLIPIAKIGIMKCNRQAPRFVTPRRDSDFCRSGAGLAWVHGSELPVWTLDFGL